MDITDRLIRGDAGTAHEASVLIQTMRSEIAELKMRIAEIEGHNADLMVSCESYRNALMAEAGNDENRECRWPLRVPPNTPA